MKTKKEIRKCLPPFSSYRSSGPYLGSNHSKYGERLYINLLGDWGEYKSKTFLYARYLISVHNKMVPLPGEDVDHIDGNPFNDTIKNLRLIPHRDNLVKGHRDPAGLSQERWVTLKCPHCTSLFTKKRRETHLVKGTNLTFCSKECARFKNKYKGTQQEVLEETEEVAFSRKQEDWFSWSTPTDTPPTRTPSKIYTLTCLGCLFQFTASNQKARYCSDNCKEQTRANRGIPDTEDTMKVVKKALNKEITWTAAGKLLGVSGNAVKKYAHKKAGCQI